MGYEDVRLSWDQQIIPLSTNEVKQQLMQGEPRIAYDITVRTRLLREGEVELVAGSGEQGGVDGSLAEASFCFPNDIVASPDGRVLYVNEVGDDATTGRELTPTRIRRIVLADG